MERGPGRDASHALEGRGARLPLLSRARPAAAASPTDAMLEAGARALPELPAERAERFERDLGLRRSRRPDAGLPRRAGRPLRGRGGRGCAADARVSPTGSPRCSRASATRTLRARSSSPPRWRGSWLWARAAGGALRRQGRARPIRGRGRRPARDRRGTRPRSRRATSWRRSWSARWPRTRTPSRRFGRGRTGDRRGGRRGDARGQRPGRRRRGPADDRCERIGAVSELASDTPRERRHVRLIRMDGSGHWTLAEWAPADEAAFAGRGARVPRPARCGYIGTLSDGGEGGDPGSRAAARGRAGDHAAPDRRRLTHRMAGEAAPAPAPSVAGTGGLVELGQVPGVSAPTVASAPVRASGCAWTLVYTVPFIAAGIVLVSAAARVPGGGGRSFAHAWIIPELYA